MRYSLLIIATLLCFHVSFATENEAYYQEVFQKANIAYKMEAYDSAKALYSSIIQNGMISSELYFNLANCHYKTGQIASARLYYERALRLDPRNEDILYNIEITKSMTSDKIEEIEPFVLAKVWQDISLTFSVQQWTIIILVLLMCLAMMIGLFLIAQNRVWKQVGFFLAIGFFVGAIISFNLTEHAQAYKSRAQGVIFSPTITVKSEPSINATDQFVVHEGLLVNILDQDGDWMRIELLDGNSGWVRTESLESI